MPVTRYSNPTTFSVRSNLTQYYYHGGVFPCTAQGRSLQRDGTCHVNDVGVSPSVSLVYLNPWTVFNHMNAVIMCSD